MFKLLVFQIREGNFVQKIVKKQLPNEVIFYLLGSKSREHKLLQRSEIFDPHNYQIIVGGIQLNQVEKYIEIGIKW